MNLITFSPRATTPRNEPRAPRRLAYGALLFFTVLVGAVTFVLSFSGLDDYGSRVAGLGFLSPLVPIGVDGLTLCAVAATFLLRHARWRARAYAWSVFAIAVASSVAGNLSHAAAKELSSEGMVGAAAWPILLALASHMVIVVRRNMEIPQQTEVSAPVSSLGFDHERPIGPEPAPRRVDRVSTSKPVARKPQPSSRERVERAHKRTPAATNEQLAERLNLSTKTVQRWRPERPDSVATANDSATTANKVNGKVPDLEEVNI